jgi:transposase
MTRATTIGPDIAKQVFQVHGADRSGRVVLRRKLRRSEVARFFSEQPPRLVGIEASGSAHYWARVLGGLGHTVLLMAPQFVKPYVKSQKNDANDAEAICEAVTRPNMRFVPQKSVEQQDLQCLHRVRSRLVANRTQLINQIPSAFSSRGNASQRSYLTPICNYELASNTQEMRSAQVVGHRDCLMPANLQVTSLLAR